jgi:hypothetical protein
MAQRGGSLICFLIWKKNFYWNKYVQRFSFEACMSLKKIVLRQSKSWTGFDICYTKFQSKVALPSGSALLNVTNRKVFFLNLFYHVCRQFMRWIRVGASLGQCLVLNLVVFFCSLFLFEKSKDFPTFLIDTEVTFYIVFLVVPNCSYTKKHSIEPNIALQHKSSPTNTKTRI